MWHLDESDGELRVHTGVTGRAAKMGHRLTIAMDVWRAEVQWTEGEPTAVDLTVEVDSLRVVRGEGGITPLSGPEKALARSNALKALDAERFPQIHFEAANIEPVDGGYRLTGALDIHGTARPHVVDVRVGDLGAAWQITCNADVRQTDFGVKPYSMFMGSMKVVDTVTVSFTAQRSKES